MCECCGNTTENDDLCSQCENISSYWEGWCNTFYGTQMVSGSLLRSAWVAAMEKGCPLGIAEWNMKLFPSCDSNS